MHSEEVLTLRNEGLVSALLGRGNGVEELSDLFVG